MSTININDYSGVWVLLEVNRKRKCLQKVSLELLGEARRLADILGQSTGALLLDAGIPNDFAATLGGFGCNAAYVVTDPSLAEYDTNLFADIIAKAVRRFKPAAVLMPASEFGRDLAPRVAGKLAVGLTADCTSLDIDGDRNLVQIRPTYGGNIMASIISPKHRPQLATVRPNVLPIVKTTIPTDTEIIDAGITVDPALRLGKLVGTSGKDTVYRDVAEAEIIVSGGYGLGGKENFHLVARLAGLLNAAVGATRKAVDEGWVIPEVQVGQTGKTVAPDLYIACGISGALQHSIGIKSAKHIIAINSDPAAPIFSMSDIAILGDVSQILPRLCEQVEQYGISALTGGRVAL